MLTSDKLDRLQRRLELWDRPGNPITVNDGLQLVELARLGLEAERLNREADWLADLAAATYCAQEGRDCKETRGKPFFEGRVMCMACWRKAACEAVEACCNGH